MSIPESPQTREEMYLNAIASSGAIPASPQTRQEMYLNAIATGDSSGIPDSPQTREEMYLDEIARNGGGGGDKNLMTSDWINYYDALVSISGNAATMQAGDSSHFNLLKFAPTAEFDRERQFRKGHTFKIAITITALGEELKVSCGNSNTGTIESATGLFVRTAQGVCRASQIGSDVLTYTRSANSGDLIINPYSASGNQHNESAATIEITGMMFNDTLIYGSVTPPSA